MRRRYYSKCFYAKFMSMLIIFGLLAGRLFELGVVMTSAAAEDSVVAEKPLMGWSSYSMQVYDGGGNWTSAEKIKEQSDAMKEYLQDYGYEYINIDAGWNGGSDEWGRPIPSETLYPNGFQEVIDYVHNNGQKIGIYMIPGMSIDEYNKNTPIYGTEYTAQDIVVYPLVKMDYWESYTYKIDFSHPGAQAYIDSIGNLLAEWGIDFVKFDSVTPGSGINNTSKDARDDVKAWYQALSKHGIWLELSWALDHNYVAWWKEYSNGWRIHWDIESYDKDKGMVEWSSVARLFPTASIWWRDAGVGGWNDFDSLNVGNGAMSGLTKDERKTAATFWAVSCAQFYIGDDMTQLDDYGLSLLTNEEVIAVNQNGKPAHPVSMDTNQQVWYVNNGDGTYNVALFNLGSTRSSVNVNWKDIGLQGSASIRNLWSHEELGEYENGYTAQLEPHASLLFKVTAGNGSSSINDDDTGITYVGNWIRNSGKELEKKSQGLVITVEDTTISTRTIDDGTQQDRVNLEINAKEETEEVSVDYGESEVDSIQTDKEETHSSIVLEEDTAEYDTLSESDALNAGEYENENSVVRDENTADMNVNAAESDTYMESNGMVNEEDIENSIYTEESISETDISVDLEPFSEQLYSSTQYVYINDTDSQINYSGSWGYSSGRSMGDYLDDVHYGEANGDYFEYTFQGTGVAVLTEMHESQGEMDIYIDGVYMDTIDTYLSQGRLAQQIVYSISDLADSYHTIKAVKKSGSFMLLDTIRVEKADLITPYEVIFDKNIHNQQDIQIVLLNESTNLSGIYYNGTALTAGQDYSINDNTVTIFKEFLAGLPEGSVNLDFLFNGDYQDDIHYTEADGDYFQYSFTGNGIQLLGATGPEQGDIDIYIDGEYKQTVSTYSDIRLSGQQIYEITALTNGDHTIKAVKASGEIMTVDQLIYSFAFETVTPETEDTSEPTSETPDSDDSSDQNSEESDSDDPSNAKDSDTTVSSGTKTSTTVQKQTKTGNSPKTGDEAAFLLLGIGCFISILAVFLISRKQRVKNK